MKKTITFLLALALALSLGVSAAASSYTDYTPRALKDGETLRRGIDVSQYQGKIDWSAVADSGVEFAIIRVGYRGSGESGKLMRDIRFEENLRGAHENGILVGAYIHTQAITKAEAREEAQFVASLVEGYQIDLPLVFDQEFFENSDGFTGRLYDADLSRDEMTNLCVAFCDEVERLGYESMVYMNPFMLSAHVDRARIGRLWLANYQQQTQYTGEYEYWQCSCTGRVDGISTDVDLDFWFAPESAPLPLMRFTDVSATHWAYADLRLAVASGWIKGYPDGSFRPENTLTRADFVTMLARLSGEDLSVFTGSVFPDVPAAEYYAQSVAWAVKSGIVNGFPDGAFHPSEQITREQMAHIMALYLNHAGLDTALTEDGVHAVDNQIADLRDIGDWALDDVRFCYAVGLLNGRGSGFVPAGTATRAEAGTVLARLDRYATAQSTSEAPETETAPETTSPAPDYGVVLSVPEMHIGD